MEEKLIAVFTGPAGVLDALRAELAGSARSRTTRTGAVVPLAFTVTGFADPDGDSSGEDETLDASLTTTPGRLTANLIVDDTPIDLEAAAAALAARHAQVEIWMLVRREAY